jgi:FkbM family methyltransferase
MHQQISSRLKKQWEEYSPVDDFNGFRLLCLDAARRNPPALQQNRPVWIFGAGTFGRDLCTVLKHEGFEIRGFIQSDARNEFILDLPVRTWRDISPESLTEQLAIGIFNRDMPLDELKAIAASAGFRDIFMPWDLYVQFGEQLGWRFWLSPPELITGNLSAIERTYLSLADEESRRTLLEVCAFRLGIHTPYAGFTHVERAYFNHLTVPPLQGKKITYVDGGAYNGDTFLEIDSLLEVAEAYLFEPDGENYRALVAAVKSVNGTALCLPLALTEQYTILPFHGMMGEGCALSTLGSVQIAAAALDEIVPSRHLDFIKLDVEGAEIQALGGAAGVIRRSRPILAISLYHKPEDIWRIPDLLSGICDNYQFYIRQHCYNSFELVLYAIPEEAAP